MIILTSKNSAKICCSGNCPSVTHSGDNIVIKDDFGGEVKMSVEEAKWLSEAVEAVCKPKAEPPQGHNLDECCCVECCYIRENK